MSDTKPSVPLHKSHRGSREGGYIPYTTHSSQRPSFYVNPVTGILCIAPLWKRPKKDDKGPGFFIKKNAAQEPVFYLRHNSMWFCFAMSRIPAGRAWGDQQSWRRKALNQGPAAISADADIKDTYWQWMYRHEKAKSYSDRFTGAVGYIDSFSVGTSYGTYHHRYYCSGKMRQLGKAELEELGLKTK